MGGVFSLSCQSLSAWRIIPFPVLPRPSPLFPSKTAFPPFSFPPPPLRLCYLASCMLSFFPPSLHCLSGATPPRLRALASSFSSSSSTASTPPSPLLFMWRRPDLSKAGALTKRGTHDWVGRQSNAQACRRCKQMCVCVWACTKGGAVWVFSRLGGRRRRSGRRAAFPLRQRGSSGGSRAAALHWAPGAQALSCCFYLIPQNKSGLTGVCEGRGWLSGVLANFEGVNVPELARTSNASDWLF